MKNRIIKFPFLRFLKSRIKIFFLPHGKYHLITYSSSSYYIRDYMFPHDTKESQWKKRAFKESLISFKKFTADYCKNQTTKTQDVELIGILDVSEFHGKIQYTALTGTRVKNIN